MDHWLDADQRDGLESKSNDADLLSGEAKRDEAAVALKLRLAPETEPTPELSAGMGAGERGTTVGEGHPPSISHSPRLNQPATPHHSDSDEAEEWGRAATLYPKERHYSTLDAMQRLTKLFGYAAIMIVFPYLTFKFARIFWMSETGLLQEVGAFLEFAVPVLFGTVGLVGLLFTLSEGLRLAMDVQENTLRIANRSGRRKR